MTQFHIYSEELPIGCSELELGDPPIGVAFGKFIPGQNYQQIQSLVTASMGIDQRGLSLSVRLLGGTTLECAGVSVEDHSAELGSDGLEVSVLGISNPPYEQLFPNQVAVYSRQFSTDG